jgi:DNA-binding transcriptional ArsR family regulator
METVALAKVASVLADPSRATMCMALLDGRAWTVGELARAARVRPSTASEHIAALRTAGFVSGVRQGRHSYVRIAGPQVAELIEHLAQHAEHRPATGLRQTMRAQRLAFARTCYDHLAGTLGVAVRDGMLRRRLVDDSSGLVLTPHGREVLTGLGVRVPSGTRRPLLRDCLDWTERREHLAGAVPAALLSRALDAGWLTRDPHRGVHVRPGCAEPFTELGVDLAAMRRTG